MPATIDLTEQAVFVGLRAFVLDVLTLPANQVVKGQQNRVPMPAGTNFVVITPSGRARLATNVRTYVPSDDPAPADGQRQTQQQTRMDVQIDVYGPASAENAQIISTLLRDAYGCDFLRPHACQPLYTGDPRQLPLVTGEQQYLARWMLGATLQFNPTVSTSQQFADIVDITLVEADQNGE
jgi:hypothetical protein